MNQNKMRGWKSYEKTILPKSWAKTCEVCHHDTAIFLISFYDGRGSFQEQAQLCPDCWKQEVKAHESHN